MRLGMWLSDVDHVRRRCAQGVFEVVEGYVEDGQVPASRRGVGLLRRQEEAGVCAVGRVCTGDFL